MSEQSMGQCAQKSPINHQTIITLLEHAERVKVLNDLARKVEIECQYTCPDTWSAGLELLLEMISSEADPLISRLEKLELEVRRS